MDPIAISTFTGGENAVLNTPMATAAFNPAASGDYAPNAPVSTSYRGFQSEMDVNVVGATMAFTIQTNTKPAGLVADQTTLDLRGETWRVVKWRERRYLGQINGYTLYLAI